VLRKLERRFRGLKLAEDERLSLDVHLDPRASTLRLRL
jgi:hypothetical protein